MYELNDTFRARFWAKVKKTPTCWLWTAYRNSQRYGYIGANGRRGQMLSAHRASWILHNGPIPPGAHVLHTCDNPACVNPAHLELGDQEENMRQKRERNRCSSRVVFTVDEVRLLKEAHASGMSKAEIARRTGMDYGTLLRVLSGKYNGRAPLSLS